jgi:DNA-directed RNA polymerase subunit RPC12/RpoP
MPQQVLCDNCGELLYQGEDIKSPEEIHQMHNGRCPKCGRKLSIIPQKVEVFSAKEYRKT